MRNEEGQEVKPASMSLAFRHPGRVLSLGFRFLKSVGIYVGTTLPELEGGSKTPCRGGAENKPS
jgi:hypothetical protein